MIRAVLLALAASAFLAGCAAGGQVSDADQKANEQKYSQAGYEDAMKKAGRGQELEKEKEIAAARNAR